MKKYIISQPAVKDLEENDGIEIIRVVSGYRNLESLFLEDNND